MKKEIWSYQGEPREVINISCDHSSRTLSENSQFGMTFAAFVFDVVLALNCKLKDYDGTMRELNTWDGVWIVNNSRHELFGKLVDVKTSEVIA